MASKKRTRRVHSIANELLVKSREAALCAVQVFNNPLIRFKSESYIVLMVIAWTYLLHAYYRRKGIEYRYFEQRGKRRSFHRTRQGAFKYWELERCLNTKESPIDSDSANNLRFLIGLRHEIEHQMTMNLDAYLSGRYQACILNYNDYLKKLFGKEAGIDEHLMYALQFTELSHEQATGMPVRPKVPDRILSYIAEFDGALTHEEYNSARFSYRLLFKRRVVGKPGQADKVVEFIDPNSEAAKQVDKEYFVLKEVERRKHGAKQIVEMMREEGFAQFNTHHHTQLWKELDAKNPAKGYGQQLGSQFWWYDRWIDTVRAHCKENADRYTRPPKT
jgi:hypothetical protein